MTLLSRTARITAGLVGLSLALIGLAAPAASARPADPLPPWTEFFTPDPDPGAVQQVRELRRDGQVRDARLVARMVATPQAVWFTGGTPQEVRADVRQTTRQAKRSRAMATLVMYNVPGRDCSQYSSGGAETDEAYRAWVDGFAAGLPRSGRVVVVVEPDGLANLPSDCGDA